MADPMWTDVVVAVAAAVGTVAAIFAGTFSLRQLTEARRTRESSLKPWVNVVSGERWVAGTIHIPFENVGPGPALRVSVDAWFERISGDGSDQHELARARRVLLHRVNSADPDETFQVGALAASGGVSTRKSQGENHTVYPGWLAVLCRGSYEDVFGHTFPIDALSGIEPVNK